MTNSRQISENRMVSLKNPIVSLENRIVCNLLNKVFRQGHSVLAPVLRPAFANVRQDAP